MKFVTTLKKWFRRGSSKARVETETTFENALNQTIEYLSSDEFKSREDAQTTLPAIKDLQEVNRKGYLTVDSQQGVIEKGQNSESNHLYSNHFYEIRERAYLDGFMKKEQAYKFIDWLNTYTDKIAFQTYAVPGKEFEKVFNQRLDGRIPTIPVTVSASTLNKDETLTKFTPYTAIPTILPKYGVELEKKDAHIKASENVIMVVVIDPIYGRHAMSTPGGLFEDVFKALDASQASK
jgi:hypothetical protein